jgi:ketosteroid isomerase-like protein
MKTTIVAVLVLGQLFALGHQTAAQPVSGNPAQGTVDVEIRRLNAQEVAAFLAHDPKALAALWSDDLVVTNPFNKFVTKQQVLGMVASGALGFTAYDRRIEYLHDYGDLVVVAGSETVTWAGTLPLTGKTSILRFTGIWAKQAGRWQQVARHANIVPQP